MKKMYALVAAFAAFAMVSCCGEAPKNEAPAECEACEKATVEVVEAVEAVPAAEAAPAEAPAPEAAPAQ